MNWLRVAGTLLGVGAGIVWGVRKSALAWYKTYWEQPGPSSSIAGLSGLLILVALSCGCVICLLASYGWYVAGRRAKKA